MRRICAIGTNRCRNALGETLPIGFGMVAKDTDLHKSAYTMDAAFFRLPRRGLLEPDGGGQRRLAPLCLTANVRRRK